MESLSICIPTFERERFLQWTVKRLSIDFPAAQINVADNASNDRTCWRFAERPDITYIRQPINIGPFPNMLSALGMAKRKYAVYCADDDYLLPDQVAIGIEYLETHLEVAAYCAPCEIWDEVNKKPFWNAFKVPEAVTFARSEGMELFNFLITQHIWPEHIIYRTPVPLNPRTRAYWAFADLPDILQTGALHFAAQPFYRNVLVHPVGERVQLGNEQCLTHFDEYRAGLEVMAYGLFGDGLPYAARHRIQEMISWFICTRLDVAARLREQSGNTAEADVLRKRLAIASPARDAAQAA